MRSPLNFFGGGTTYLLVEMEAKLAEARRKLGDLGCGKVPIIAYGHQTLATQSYDTYSSYDLRFGMFSGSTLAVRSDSNTALNDPSSTN